MYVQMCECYNGEDVHLEWFGIEAHLFYRNFIIAVAAMADILSEHQLSS